MKGRFFIVNDFDRPYKRMVTEKKADGLLYYTDPLLAESYKEGFSQEGATDVTDFGINIEEKEDSFVFNKISESVAKYRDGTERQWQGDDNFTILKGKK